MTHIRSDASLATLLTIAEPELANPTADLDRSKRLADALNFIGFDTVASQRASEVRMFLHALLDATSNDVHLGTVICALRWYGDDDSVQRIKALPPLSQAWEPSRRSAIRHIRARLKQDHS